MFVEQRVYTVRPGTSPAFFEYYRDTGLAIQTSILGDPIGYYGTEFGALNQIVMNWAYASLDERSAKREKLVRTDEWITYLKHARANIVAQESRILKPAPFFEARLKQYVSMGRTS